ncbi:MAG: HigA family addiction module antidote protein [Cytophagales bacterium]|nr:HigA family addiction module antidote protein [Cytophagales bacterium]
MKMRPVHPGEIIRHDYLEPLDLTIGDLANSLGITRPMLSAIINGRSSVSPEMAIRLSRAFDTTPDLWLGMQRSFDLYHAKEKFNPEGVVKKVYSSQLVS